MKNSNDQIFKTERKNTDESLDEEREKTNQSIVKAHGLAESQTDVKVQKEREQTDKAKLKARTAADSVKEQDRKFEVGSPASRPNTDRAEIERRRDDEAMTNERARIDVVIEQEREVKNKIETTILRQERARTDKNLADERTTTDKVVNASTIKLSKEVAEHSKTKISLTTRDEFLAIVSHDLRNPIGVISSCMGMLLENAVDRKIDSETKYWLELAKRNADSSLRMISDILDLERIAQDKLELSIAPFDIGKMIRETLDNFAQAALAKNIQLSFLPFVSTENIDCDHDRVVQILSNLVGNALKYTPAGGKIVAKAEYSDEFITISVCDTGPGIPIEKKQKIFEKFAQLGSTHRNGLGLGLHISKMLVEAHGGTLWVESKLGEGSTFYFSLPKERLSHG